MSNPRLHILLIEDDENDYILTREMLAEIDNLRYQLEWAKTYQEGLQQLLADQHDIFLVDYRLGKEDGLELLREAIFAGCQRPIIMLTGQQDRALDVAAMKSGAADYLVKGQVNAVILERSIRYALERTRLLKILSVQATRDELTGLYNRREMERIVEDEVERFRRYKYPSSLIILDIDNFKIINDSFGHPAGDKVLQYLAQSLLHGVRTIDKVARHGGDEFSLILPATIGDKALILAERLNRTIASQSCEIQGLDGGTQQVSITVSMGIAQITSEANTKEALMQAADQALYKAKSLGKNCVFRNAGA